MTAGFTRPRPDVRVMEQLKVALRSYDPPTLGYYSTAELELVRFLEEAAWELRTTMLADNLGTEEIRTQRSETVFFPRFATWWDHWKATYRGRWWMRWRRWDVRYIADDVTVTAKVAVDVTRYWAYPQADVPPPEFGAPVRWITHRWHDPYRGSQDR